MRRRPDLEKSSKSTISSNNRPITSLPKTWKILTTQFRKEIYWSLVYKEQFPEKRKLCHRGSRGTGDLPYSAQQILKETKASQKKCCHWVHYLQEELHNCRANLDNRLFENIWKYPKKSYDLSRESWETGVVYNIDTPHARRILWCLRSQLISAGREPKWLATVRFHGRTSTTRLFKILKFSGPSFRVRRQPPT